MRKKTDPIVKKKVKILKTKEEKKILIVIQDDLVPTKHEQDVKWKKHYENNKKCGN